MALASAPTLLGADNGGTPSAVTASPTAGALVIALAVAYRTSSNPGSLTVSPTGISLDAAAGLNTVISLASGALRYRVNAWWGIAPGGEITVSAAASGSDVALMLVEWIGASGLANCGQGSSNGAGTLTGTMPGSPAASSAAISWAMQAATGSFNSSTGWVQLAEQNGPNGMMATKYDAPGSPETSCSTAVTANASVCGIAEVVEAPPASWPPPPLLSTAQLSMLAR